MKIFTTLCCLPLVVVFLLVGCEKGATDKEKANKDAKSSSYWVEYHKDDEGNVTYYKWDSNEPNKGKDIVQISEKMYFSEKGREHLLQLQKQSGNKAEGWDKLSHVIVASEYDCKNHRQRLMSHVSYDTNGNVLGTVTIAEPQWTPIIPDSKGDILQKKFCQ